MWCIIGISYFLVLHHRGISDRSIFIYCIVQDLPIIVVISRKRRSFRHAKKVRKCGSHGPGGGRRPCIARYRWRIAQYDFRIGLEIREADAKHSACTTRRRKESAAKRRAGDATKKVRNWSRFLSRWTHSDISGDRHSALAASRATTSRLAMSAAERAPWFGNVWYNSSSVAMENYNSEKNRETRLIVRVTSGFRMRRLLNN